MSYSSATWRRPRRSVFKLLLFYFILLSSCFFALLIFGFWTSTAQAESNLVIGEINWAGSSLSTADEWLELWNLGDAELNLAGFTLTGASTAPAIVLGSTDIVQPHSVFLISNYQTGDEKSELTIASQLVTSTLALSNEKMDLRLVDPTGTLVDQAGDGQAPLAGSTGEQKLSMLRIAPTTSGDQRDGWASVTSTPGFLDLPFATSSYVSTPSAVSTESGLDQIMEQATTSEPTISQSTSSEALATNTHQTGAETQATSTDLAATTTILLDIHLNEVFPAPSSGPEWIELYVSDTIDVTALNDWVVEDALGPIFRVSSSTPINAALAPYILITLSGHHLNNDGDTVRLKNPRGDIVDEIAYSSIKKNEAFIRFPDNTGAWQISTMPTPAAANVLIDRPHESTSAPVQMIYASPVSITPPVSIPVLPVQPKNITEPKPTSPNLKPASAKTQAPASPIPQARVKGVSTSTESNLKLVTTKTGVTKQPTTKKTAVVSYPLETITISMLNTIDATTRVYLSGIVASVPKLLATSQFVLQTEDGRGLLVYGNGKQRSPEFGSLIGITGTLTVNDQGATLHMRSADRWMLKKKTAEVKPRPVDLGAPSQEDGWSLVDVTGTVEGVRGSNILLSVEDVSISVIIRPVVQFRA